MRLMIVSVILFLSNFIVGQKQVVWFDVGLKAQYGAAGLYNKAIADSDNYSYDISKGYAFGAKLGINFAYSGIAIDVMRSSAKQQLEQKGTAITPTVDWSALDIYVLFRNAKNLGYFEVGPKISFISKVEDNIEATVTDRSVDYNKNVISGVVGFGANVMGNDGRFSGILGLRLEYGFTDFVNDAGKNSSAPLRDASVYASNGYKSSNVAFAGVVFELNWGVGYFGKAQCGKRSKFIMF
ncbi:MAG: hypothetical protein WAU01_05650 [Saprospiraceae bacterium]